MLPVSTPADRSLARIHSSFCGRKYQSAPSSAERGPGPPQCLDPSAFHSFHCPSMNLFRPSKMRGQASNCSHVGASGGGQAPPADELQAARPSAARAPSGWAAAGGGAGGASSGSRPSSQSCSRSVGGPDEVAAPEHSRKSSKVAEHSVQRSPSSSTYLATRRAARHPAGRTFSIAAATDSYSSSPSTNTRYTSLPWRVFRKAGMWAWAPAPWRAAGPEVIRTTPFPSGPLEPT
mmetsp:Transcript_69260/g.183836  ORF Transcript_69260/g.183836 Transcript_69260/m.183836 type:complete len:234 (+) Transcript_69260:1125-1826(+)